MKVLMINVSCGTGSTGRICTDLASSLEKYGHEVKIAYGRDQVQPQFQKYAVRIGSDFEVKMHALYARAFDASGFGSQRGTKKFISWIKEYDPDIIHLHNVHGYYINIPILFSYLKKCGKAIIWTMHDCWAFTGHAAYCDAANCDKWILGCHHCPNIREYPRSFVDQSKRNWINKRLLLRNIPNLSIVTPSQWLAKLAKKSFLAQYPVRVIYNGVDSNKFFPLKNDLRDYFAIGYKHIIACVVSVNLNEKEVSICKGLAEKLGENWRVFIIGCNGSVYSDFPNNITIIRGNTSSKEQEYLFTEAEVIIDLSEAHTVMTLYYYQYDAPIISCTHKKKEDYAGKSIPINIENVDSIITKVYSVLNDQLNDHKAESQCPEMKTGRNNTGNDGFWKCRNEMGVLGDRVAIGVASIWDKRKGLDDLVYYSCKSKTKLIIVGVTNEQKKQLSKNIIAFTRTNNVEELRKLYAVADVFVNPTYEDNFPTTNIEAMSCGTPVVTYLTGGSPEAGGDYAGKIVDRNNLVDTVDSLYISINRCEERSQNFTVDRMISDYMQLYRGNQ